MSGAQSGPNLPWAARLGYKPNAAAGYYLVTILVKTLSGRNADLPVKPICHSFESPPDA
jgi:hypothetical protein